MEAESLLLGAFGKDYGDGVFKHLAPRTLAKTYPSPPDTVFNLPRARFGSAGSTVSKSFPLPSPR